MITVEKNFRDIELVDALEMKFKDKILKFSWYNRIEVSFPVGSMCKYSFEFILKILLSVWVNIEIKINFVKC